MRVELMARICPGQDGAIWGGFFFRFKSTGECCVYELSSLIKAGGELAKAFATFRLDRADMLLPHSNAVCFGGEYAIEGDAFPLLYTNIYNNYAKAEDRLEGMCCVYRIWRKGVQFHTELVQLIQVGFTKDTSLWYSENGCKDVRPYGNFAIDRQSGRYYGFVMRDESNTTRYFSYRLPKLSDGRVDERFGIRKVVLTTEDIIDYFDCPYHRYLQGACVHDGLLYSLEGFTDDLVNPPALRIIDPQNRAQRAAYALQAFGLSIEPEFIDFGHEQCYYADHDGNLYRIQF